REAAEQLAARVAHVRGQRGLDSQVALASLEQLPLVSLEEVTGRVTAADDSARLGLTPGTHHRREIGLLGHPLRRTTKSHSDSSAALAGTSGRGASAARASSAHRCTSARASAITGCARSALTVVASDASSNGPLSAV